ncbi:lytic polysaccharide monooxygenase [Chromobacterium alticapitis]|uniref:Chitin-binding protein n=1 Tax=Chromobacterium alticapitis TaxID=2073169 RepID=A0A2S5DDP4_9NEIS|nr:lytic polysaccharide monooxygenase [Chromobacterium alticapitis]POZ61223.1 chitin-binding protein [Chromobacterium alticapitis]
MKRQWQAILPLLLSGLNAPLWAHGTMEVPVNRVYSCYLEGPETPQSAACQAVRQLDGAEGMYNWNGINRNPPGDNHQAVVPDGQLCGGGQATFRSFNLPRDDWKTTPIAPDAAGNFEFVYKATAPHASKYFRFYVTKDGWRDDHPLRWADLELFGTYNGTPPLDANKRYHMTMKLPPGKSGRHILYNVWKRSDSEEAFYSCSDVVFAAGAKQAAPLANAWKEIGRVVAHGDLPAGGSATLRVFDAMGRDAESQSMRLNAASGRAANWPYELARQVNAASRIIRIGALGVRGGEAVIEPSRDAAANRVYLNDGYPGYSYTIDLKKDGPAPR